MNQMPSDWSAQLEAAYPKRSGPSGWRSNKLMLALRRALFESTWEQIIDGCKNYAKYCEEGGKTGSEFVQAPTRFIEDGSYLEAFAFKAAEDPKVVEARNREKSRWEQALLHASRLDPVLRPLQHESAAAFETRIALQRTRDPAPTARTQDSDRDAGNDRVRQLGNRITEFNASRRIAK